MEHLLFTIWMLLFPIMDSINNYIGAKTKILKDHEHYLYKKDTGIEVFGVLVLYFFVGYLLY